MSNSNFSFEFIISFRHWCFFIIIGHWCCDTKVTSVLYSNNFMGKCAKIAIVNLKMCNYNSGKLKGAKLYIVNQNGAKLSKCAKIVIVNLNVRFPDVTPPSVNDVSYI